MTVLHIVIDAYLRSIHDAAYDSARFWLGVRFSGYEYYAKD